MEDAGDRIGAALKRVEVAAAKSVFFPRDTSDLPRVPLSANEYIALNELELLGKEEWYETFLRLKYPGWPPTRKHDTFFELSGVGCEPASPSDGEGDDSQDAAEPGPESAD